MLLGIFPNNFWYNIYSFLLYGLYLYLQLSMIKKYNYKFVICVIHIIQGSNLYSFHDWEGQQKTIFRQLFPPACVGRLYNVKVDEPGIFHYVNIHFGM